MAQVTLLIVQYETAQLFYSSRVNFVIQPYGKITIKTLFVGNGSFNVNSGSLKHTMRDYYLFIREADIEGTLYKLKELAYQFKS